MASWKRAFTNDAAMQILRYGLVGGAITLLGAIVYYVCAQFLGIAPLIANSVAFVTGVLAGYGAHSRISFAGHGAPRDVARTGTRFAVVNLVGYAVNSGFVWLLTGPLNGPNWWPIIPMVFVTPLLTYLLHRRWTFG